MIFLLEGLGPAMFSNSFSVDGSNWGSQLRQEFFNYFGGKVTWYTTGLLTLLKAIINHMVRKVGLITGVIVELVSDIIREGVSV